MTSRWLCSIPSCLIIIVITLVILPTIYACAHTRGLQEAGCFCDERPDYDSITCRLPKNKSTYIIYLGKENQYDIDCQNHHIDDMDLIPALFDRSRTINFYGYTNCSLELFQNITDKLFARTRNFDKLEFKKMNKIDGSILQGFQINTLTMEKNYFNELPHNLLEHLPNLTNLAVTENANLVTIPATLFTYTKQIKTINLGYNKINTIPVNLFANLTELISINLFNNKLSSIDEQLFAHLPNVKVVDLLGNKLETIPKLIFKDLHQLQEVVLRKNLFQTLPEDLFAHNLQLKDIKLWDNPYLSELPEKLFANLRHLEIVHLHYCNLSWLPDDIFADNTKITEIKLSYNKLKRLSRNVFRSLENLKKLSLERNNLEILEDNIFENTRKLEELDLGYNQIIVTDYTFDGLRNLVTLKLNNNFLSELSVRSISYFRRLKDLDMSYNNLTLQRKNSPILSENSILPLLDSLRKLNLKNNVITSIYSDWNLNMLELEDLNLANNKISYLSYNDLQFLQNKTLTINLENNLITTINLSSAELLLRQNLKNKAKKIVQLKGNPIRCDCNIYDFVRYLDKTMSPYVYDVLELQIGDLYDPLTCQSPEKYKGQKLNEINSKQLTCTLHDGPILTENCSMQYYEYQIAEKRLIVNCSNNGLTKLPRILLNRSGAYNYSGQEIKVYLSGNKITEMPGPNMGYENVIELDLSHNFINEITWVPPNIQVLKLDHNNLTYLNNAELSLINQTSIKNVTFHNNPWICNCQLINFTKYLQENFQKIPKLHNITCANTEKRLELTRLTSEDLCPFSTLLIIVICAFLVFAALLTCILIAMYYRYKTQIKVWLYAHNMCLYLITEEEVDQDKPYDAFISFSHEDEDFVVNELMPGLETGPHPFKLCVHFRDFQPGEFITTNIMRAIDSSRRTVVVVSKGFLNSEWGKMEFRTAHTEALKEGRARVIMIVYGDLGPTDDLDAEIRAYLSTNTYVKWGSPWFWDNLRYALPHSSKYARAPEIIVKQPMPQINRNTDDKVDLMYEPATPPAATTPPADSINRLSNPLLTPSALNVSLINGSLINNFQEKNKQNNNYFNSSV